jgi:TIR domain
MPAIYISYRKEDTQGAAAHLYKNLTEAFGRKAVFMDVAGSQPGRDVRDVVDDHLVSCAAVLVIIGKDWADARDAAGQRRLDNPLDLVRIETAAALTQGLPVIPVLVQGATMPQPTELPPDLADLAYRNPVTLQQSQWGSDVETLVALLKSLIQGSAQGVVLAAPDDMAGDPATAPTRARVARPQPVGRLPWGAMFAAVAGVGVLALGVYAFMVRGPLGKGAAPAQEVASAAAQGGPAPTVMARADVPAAPVPAANGSAAPASAVLDMKVAPPPPAPRPAPPAPATAAPVAPKVEPAAKAAVAAVPAAPAAPGTVPTNPPVQGAAPAETASPALPPLASKSAKVLTFRRWTLNSGGCGAGPLTVTGTARFSVEKTSDAIIVTEEFRGSGSGYEVVVSGQVEFGSEQPSYEIPTSGVWTGPRPFKTTGIDRVNTSDGLTPSGASVVRFQSLCG